MADPGLEDKLGRALDEAGRRHLGAFPEKYRIIDIAVEVSSIQYMDSETLLLRFGKSLREARKRRGLTQLQLAKLAAVPRLKVIQVERGEPSVSIRFYADIAAALGLEFATVPARRPTLEEVREMLADE